MVTHYVQVKITLKSRDDDAIDALCYAMEAVEDATQDVHDIGFGSSGTRAELFMYVEAADEAAALDRAVTVARDVAARVSATDGEASIPAWASAD